MYIGSRGQLLFIPKAQTNRDRNDSVRSNFSCRRDITHEKLGSIMEYITLNDEEESLPQSRLKSDLVKLQKIKERYGIE